MGPLVDVPTLAASLAGGSSLSGGSPPLVLDVRWRLGGPPGVDSYRAGHVPGALFVDLDASLSGPPGSAGRHPMPAADLFEAAMRALGVSDERPVVAYDDGDSMPAARAWWLLRYFGHPSVRVLDGGFAAWTAAGLPVTADAADPPAVPGSFTARPGGMPLLDAAGAGALAAGDGLLIDVRTAERYRGENEPVDPVAGHIPGAVNVPIASTANPDGTFKSPAELAALVPPARSACGVYCGSGVTAARGVLALELAGRPAALYVGSWSEWITDPSRPVAPASLGSHDHGSLEPIVPGKDP